MSVVANLEREIETLKQANQILTRNLMLDPEDVAARVACSLVGNTGVNEPIAVVSDGYSSSGGIPERTETREEIISRYVEAFRKQNVQRAAVFNKGKS